MELFFTSTSLHCTSVHFKLLGVYIDLTLGQSLDVIHLL